MSIWTSILRPFGLCLSPWLIPCIISDKLRFGFRGFTSRPILSAMDPVTRYIHEFNKNGVFEKWGWVFYRCTYNNDEGWNYFKQMITQEMHKDIANSDTPDINHLLDDNLKMTFIEDRKAFDGASKDQLRAHFQDGLRTRPPLRTRMLLGSLIQIWCLLPDIDTLFKLTKTRYAAFFMILRSPRGY